MEIILKEEICKNKYHQNNIFTKILRSSQNDKNFLKIKQSVKVRRRNIIIFQSYQKQIPYQNLFSRAVVVNRCSAKHPCSVDFAHLFRQNLKIYEKNYKIIAN